MTFSCVAHHAYPPVVLRWVKKSGPSTDFGALPLSMTVAPDGTIATSTRLILSPLNHGSEFSCIAGHPTFMGKTFSSDLQFVIADTKAASACKFLCLSKFIKRLDLVLANRNIVKFDELLIS